MFKIKLQRRGRFVLVYGFVFHGHTVVPFDRLSVCHPGFVHVSDGMLCTKVCVWECVFLKIFEI